MAENWDVEKRVMKVMVLQLYQWNSKVYIERKKISLMNYINIHLFNMKCNYFLSPIINYFINHLLYKNVVTVYVVKFHNAVAVFGFEKDEIKNK